MQRDTGNTESITVEYGFLDSTGDDVAQLKNNWKVYAEAVVRAIVDYLNLNYVPVEGDNYYTVQKGESLWSIAKKLGTTVNELKESNNLKNNNLSIGQVLKVPVKQNTEGTYTVQKGDSLYRIAQKYNTTVNELIRVNNLSNTNLSIGQVLKIPMEATSEETYIVKKGDGLYKIAQMYNTTVNELIKINNLSNTNLSIGQVLKLPTNNNVETYTVKAGDSLYKIAQKYNTTVNELMKINNLNSTLLSIGQVIRVK